MNIQPKAPSFDDSLAQDVEAIKHCLHVIKSGEPVTGGSYLHWSHLGQHTQPAYLNLREWWLALKIQRSLGRTELALKDRNQQPFTLGSVEFFAEAIHGLDRHQSGEAADGEVASRRQHDHLMVEALRDEAIASAQLDGASVDPQSARELLRSGHKPQGRDEQMVVNTCHVLARVREIYAEPLTLATLADLHQRLTVGTAMKGDPSGRLRRADDLVREEGLAEKWEFKPPPAAELPTRLKAMLAFANGRAPERFVHPLLRAAALHFWVLHDQPFAEGNGRLARALYYWCVLHAGYDFFECLAPSAVLSNSPTAYRRAFHDVLSDENDLMYFAAHLFDAIAKAQRQCREAATRWDEELRGTASLPGANELNDRQRLLLAQALKEPGFRRTLLEHARDHHLVRQTARHDFAPLVKMGWFEEAKVGRALTFFPAPDLAERVKNFTAKDK